MSHLANQDASGNLSISIQGSHQRDHQVQPDRCLRRLGGLGLFWPFTLVFILLQVAGPSVATTRAQDEAPKERRKIFVPMEELEVLLLDGNSNRVMLTQQEYASLLESAKQKSVRRAPVNSSILSASYTGVIQDGIATIRGELKIKRLNSGLIAIPLEFSGVAIRSARLDDQPAALYRTTDGQVMLLAGMKSDDASPEERDEQQPAITATQELEAQTLVLDMMLPLSTTAARQSMTFRLPATSAADLELTVPGNVEVKSGASVIQRSYDESKNETSFELLMMRQSMNIVMSLNNKQLKDEQVVVARSVSIHEVSPDHQLLHTTCSVDVINGAVEEVAFRIPDGFQIESVDSPLLNQWSVTPGPAGERSTLVVDLREATRNDFVLHIKASRHQKSTGFWKANALEPVDVAGQVTVVGVIADTRLAASNFATNSVIPIDHEFLLAAIPPTFEDSTSDSFRIVGAFYSPQSEYDVSLEFSVPQPELDVISNTRLMVKDQELSAEGGLSIVSRFDTRVDFQVKLPAGWQLDRLVDPQDQAVEYSLDSADPSRVTVKLKKRLGETPTEVFFNASTTPENWLDPWKTNQVTFPGIQIEGQTSHQGSVAIATDEDLAITPLTRQGLELLAEANKVQYQTDGLQALLAYEFESSEYQLQVSLKRVDPILLARTYNFFSVLPNSIRTHQEIIFDVKRANEDTFVFELPLDSPSSINITSSRLKLKDSSSEETATARRWTVQLSQPAKGAVHLLIDYESPQTDLAGQRALAPIIVPEIQLQNTFVILEGSSELDTKIENPGRVIDLGELSEARYQTSRQLLGAFAWNDADEPLKLTTSRRDFYPLPGAIVQSAELVSVVATDGKLQTAAKFRLVTKQLPFIEVDLPSDSTLWSVQLDGHPAKPQLQDDRLLISLMGGLSRPLRDLQIVYESPIDSIGLMGELRTDAPQLRINRSATGSADWEDVPMVDTQWRLVVPKGYTITDSNAPLESRPSVFESLVHWSISLGGGFESPWVLVREAQVAYAPESQDDSAVVDGTAFDNIEEEMDAGAPNNPFGDLENNRMRPGRRKPERPPVLAPAPEPSVNIVADPNAKGGQGMGGMQDGKRRAIQAWATQGLRSLNIQLDGSTYAAEFNRLDGTTLSAKLVNTSRMSWLAASLAAFLIGMSVLLTYRSAQLKFFWVIALIVVAQGLAYFTKSMPLFEPVIDMMLVAAILSAIYFLVVGAVARVGSRIWSWLKEALPRFGTAVFLLVVMSASSTMAASPLSSSGWQDEPSLPDNVKLVDVSNELQELLGKLAPERPIQIPDDAILIPYRATDGALPATERVLIPYQHFLQLKKQAGLEPDQAPAPRDYVIASSDYQLKLNENQDGNIEAKLVINVMTNDPVAIPLNLGRGSLANASVDGRPAKLQLVQPEVVSNDRKSQRNQQLAKSSAPTAPVTVLHLQGKGRKEFLFNFRLKPQQQGGWRSIQCQLPIGLVRRVVYETFANPIEVRIASDSDRRVVQAKKPMNIESVISQNGSLNVQWKPIANSQVVDQALTVTSDAVFDIREDGLRLNWYFNFVFRGSERNAFSVEIPVGFLVEQVLGENLRSWNVVQATGDKPGKLDIELLGTAKDSESLTVELSQRDFALSTKASSFRAPFLSVPAAALHKGTLSVRRSPIVQLKTGLARTASRIDSGSVKRQIDLKRVDSKKSPLGIRPFQDFEFIATPFVVDLNARIAPESLTTQTAVLLKIGQSKFDVESRINVTIKNRPLYQLQFTIPQDFEIEQLVANAQETWSEKIVDQEKLITVLFPNGQLNGVSVRIKGTLSSFSEVPEDFSTTLDWKLPRFQVLGSAETLARQSIDYAVQTDPAIAVTARDLKNLETISIGMLNRWLLPEQRPTTRLALRTLNGSKLKDLSGTLRLSRIRPRIDVETVTNVRTTLLAMEETMLIDFQIQNAGIREVQFELPKSRRDARINASLVSETVMEDVAGADRVLVTLKLQDDVIGSYRVVIEYDSPLPTAIETVRLPIVRTGNVKGQYIALQNAGRDEIQVTQLDGMQRLSRQLNNYSKLTQKLAGAELTLAYTHDKSANSPSLKFRLNTRKILDMVAASIGFSKTVMVVDHDGAYRAEQVFQVSNRSERYLDVQIPQEAQLLSVIVDGIPVKPVRWTQASIRDRIRIPLLKTATGDLDYPISVKYAGKLPSMTSFSETTFPVIETLNINVQLSQLHLRLPETHRWLRFGGTMTQVDEAGQLEEDYLSYQSRQIQKLAEQLESSADQSIDYFSRQRAQKNLQVQLDKYAAQSKSGKDSGKVAALIENNTRQIQSYQVELEKTLQDKALNIVDNRARFNALVIQQKSAIARNQVNRADSNFDYGEMAAQQLQVEIPGQSDGQPANGDIGQSFDRGWFESNKFSAGGKGKFDKAGQGQLRKLKDNLRRSDTWAMPQSSQPDSPGDRPASVRFRNTANGLQQRTAGQAGMGLDMGGQIKPNSGAQSASPRETSDRNFVQPPVVPKPSTLQLPSGSTVTDNSGNGPQGEVSVGAGRGRIPSSTATPSDNSDRVGLTSLSIELPARGVDFYFRSPRGKATVTAVPVKQSQFSMWLSIGVIVVGSLVSWLLFSAIQRSSHFGVRMAIAFLLIAAGLISVSTGFLPVFGLISLLVALGMLAGKPTEHAREVTHA